MSCYRLASVMPHIGLSRDITPLKRYLFCLKDTLRTAQETLHLSSKTDQRMLYRKYSLFILRYKQNIQMECRILEY